MKKRLALAATFGLMAFNAAAAELPAVPLIGDKTEQFIRHMNAAEGLIIRDVEDMSGRCGNDRACLLDGLVRIFSGYFATEGYSYTKTVESYAEAIGKSTAIVMHLKRNGMINFITPAYAIATEDGMATVTDALVNQDVLSEHAMLALASISPKIGKLQ